MASSTGSAPPRSTPHDSTRIGNSSSPRSDTMALRPSRREKGALVDEMSPLVPATTIGAAWWCSSPSGLMASWISMSWLSRSVNP